MRARCTGAARLRTLSAAWRRSGLGTFADQGLRLSGKGANVKTFDQVRIDAVENGYIIWARKMGNKPQSYAYTDRFVAKTWAEVAEILKKMEVRDG